MQLINDTLNHSTTASCGSYHGVPTYTTTDLVNVYRMSVKCDVLLDELLKLNATLEIRLDDDNQYSLVANGIEVLCEDNGIMEFHERMSDIVRIGKVLFKPVTNAPFMYAK